MITLSSNFDSFSHLQKYAKKKISVKRSPNCRKSIKDRKSDDFLRKFTKFS